MNLSMFILFKWLKKVKGRFGQRGREGFLLLEVLLALSLSTITVLILFQFHAMITIWRANSTKELFVLQQAELVLNTLRTTEDATIHNDNKNGIRYDWSYEPRIDQKTQLNTRGYKLLTLHVFWKDYYNAEQRFALYAGVVI